MFDFIHGLREKGLVSRPETLSPESQHGEGEAGLSACAGVRLFHAERMTSLLIETGEMITKAVA